MRNYIFRKGLVLVIIFLFIGASVLSIVSGDEFEYSLSTNIYTIGDRDQIDQSQLDIDNTGQIFRENIWAAQSIMPTYQIQTWLYVAICKIGSPPNDVIISLRDSLSGPDLTTATIPKDQVPAYPGILWLVADYDDIIVTPQQTYYILARTNGGDMHNYYIWFGSEGNPYPAGNPWWSEDYGYWWGANYDMDHSFETYGRDNLPPLAPTITGPNNGNPGTSYDYTFNAMDPDGDSVRYLIEWGDTTSDLTDFAPSGTDVVLSHTWAAQGSYTIKARAMDVYGVTGPETTKTVTIPRAKDSYRGFIYNFLERFPNSFKIIRQLFGN